MVSLHDTERQSRTRRKTVARWVGRRRFRHNADVDDDDGDEPGEVFGPGEDTSAPRAESVA